MEIKIGKWKIRSWEGADVPAIVKYANNRKVWINLRDSFPHPYTEKDAVEWIHRVKIQNPETQFAVASDEEAIDGIGFLLQDDVYRRSAELGYWLGEPYWGQGIATRAVRAITEYAFTHFDIVRIYIAGVDPLDFESELRDVLDQLGEETDAFIVIGNIPDLTQLPRFMDDPSSDVTLARIMTFNDIITALAVEFNIPIVDLFSVMITDDFVFDQDGFHPSNEGHQMIADLFIDVILANINNQVPPSPSLSTSPTSSPSPSPSTSPSPPPSASPSPSPSPITSPSPVPSSSPSP